MASSLENPDRVSRHSSMRGKGKTFYFRYFIKVAISRHQRTCLSFFRMSPGTKAHTDIEGWMTQASSIFLKWASLPAKKADFRCALLVTGATSPINFMLQNGEISDIKLAVGKYVLELRLQTSEQGSLKQVLQMGKQLRPTFCNIPDLPP